jgi:hypothetical protein
MFLRLRLLRSRLASKSRSIVMAEIQHWSIAARGLAPTDAGWRTWLIAKK